jgi:choline dehydrogenase-like flavoprotein
VGKNLVFSGMGRGQALFRRKRLSAPIERFPFVQRSMQDFYFNPDGIDGAAGVRKGGTILFDWAHANPIFTAERIANGGDKLLWGKALKDKLRRDVGGARRLQFETFSEYLPNPDTFMDLDPEVKDHWGLPVARITEKRHPQDFVASAMLVDRGMSVLRELRPDEWSTLEVRGVTRFLQGGTCRFGSDPESSVLDPWCRAHEVPNLYVTDGSFLPSSGGVPLTLTILASSFRVAGHIAERFRAQEL